MLSVPGQEGFPRFGWRRGRGARTAAIFALVVLAGCGVLSGDDDEPLPMYTAPGDPIEIHQRVAVLVQSCWFASDDSQFEGKSYDVVADRDKKLARIRLLEGDFEDLAEGDADPIFAVDFRGRDDATEIDFPIVPDSDGLAARLKTDIIRWANGSESC